MKAVNSVFEEVVRWRRNLFYLPTGKAGESFIEELKKLYTCFNNGSDLQPVALTMASIIFPLLLQKPSPNSKSKDHTRFLEKRLAQWKQGRIEELLEEGRAIQNRFSAKKKTTAQKKEARFIALMEQGRVSAALRCIGCQETSLVDVSEPVLNELKKLHPKSQPTSEDSLLQGPLKRKLVEEVIFENIDAIAIQKSAKHVNGAAGPSGADAHQWQRLLCSKQFKRKPSGLSAALAEFARKLNTEQVHPLYLRAFVANRLVPLDKKPGVRPIGIGEITRRIISNATMVLLKPEIVDSTAPLQTCAGLPGGIEASIHAMRSMFNSPECEAVLMVDASNAFNSLNRKVAMHNLQYTCPEMSTFIQNLYSCDAELFVAGSDEVIRSEEGTTQGGPESMAFYAAGTMGLVNSTHDSAHPASPKRIFYADDGAAAGKLVDLSNWWTHVKETGPPLGYFPNGGKTWLVVKPEFLDEASLLFPDINVTAEGHKYLRSYIGTEQGTQKFIEQKITDWTKDIDA